MPVQQRGEVLSLGGRDSEHHTRLAPGLLKRVADVTGDRRQRFCTQAMHGAPPVPGLL